VSLSIKHFSEVIIDVDCLLGHLEILKEDLGNLSGGVHNQLILEMDLPQVIFVAVGDLVVSSWDFVDLLNHLGDHFDKFVLNLGWLLLEIDLVLYNVELEGEESLLKLVVWGVSSLDDLLWSWVVIHGWSLELSHEGHILVDRLSDQLSRLITHQGCN
jgi:hypothetical protein